MAPIARIPYGLAQRARASEPTFTEKALVLLLFVHICLFLWVLWWLATSSVTGEVHFELCNDHSLLHADDRQQEMVVIIDCVKTASRASVSSWMQSNRPPGPPGP